MVETSSTPMSEQCSLNIFVPPEALQGEEIPSFAIWHGTTFDRIEVKFPDSVELRETYNVAPEDQKVEPQRLIVAHVEVNGYLGLLFKTRRLQTTSETVVFVFYFYQKSGEVIETREIQLFRPLLATGFGISI